MDDNKLFLIIDDDIDDMEMFCDAVMEVDPQAECNAALDCKEAMETVLYNLRKLPDFIFLDLNLPKMGGLDCLAALRAEDKLKTVPIIIYTTSSAPNDMLESRLLGANYFLTKTSDYKTLCDELALIMRTDWFPLITNSNSSGQTI